MKNTSDHTDETHTTQYLYIQIVAYKRYSNTPPSSLIHFSGLFCTTLKALICRSTMQTVYLIHNYSL